MKKEVEKNILKRFARDFVALGSIPFFILVLARVWILDNPAYLSQFLIGGVLFLSLAFVFKSDLYFGLALVSGFFLVLFYNDLRFTYLIIPVYILIIFSLFYLGEDKNKIIKGILFGILSIVVSYYSVLKIFG